MWIVGAQVSDDVFHLLTAVLTQLVESAESRILRIQRMRLLPSATGILVEVLTRLDRCVEIGTVNALEVACCHAHRHESGNRQK